ncbi:hypothetical protein BGZ60DRAFT_418077 [Tricladium varicosporioides]|nr:hypothetical protein BGZ60DRAFT_418077 [Hymenoscyphus varicosporioides]
MDPSRSLWRSISKQLILSYVFDGVVLIGVAIGGAVFSIVAPIKRPFSLSDPSISFPYRKDTISITTVGLVAIIAPAVITAAVCLLVTQGPTVDENPIPRVQLWYRKLWECFAGWLGLGLSVLLSFFLTQSMKNLFGKPRPDFLFRCNPDLATWQNYVVEDLEARSPKASSLLIGRFVKARMGVVLGFAFAGLVYLSLFLAAKLSVTIPFPMPTPLPTSVSRLPPHQQDPLNPRSLHEFPATTSGLPLENTISSPSLIRNQAAAPPLFLLVIIIHGGFDVLFSSLEGVLCAWFSFRFYHLSIRRGSGWSWAPRSKDRAFGIGSGVGNYVTLGDTKASNIVANRTDLESGRVTYEEAGRRDSGTGHFAEQMEMENLARRTTGRSDSSRRHLRV